MFYSWRYGQFLESPFRRHSNRKRIATRRISEPQLTGRIIHIPNSIVFTKPLINYTKGFRYIWNEMPATETFGSDWKKSKEILQEIVTIA
ncbi:MAG: mechanosensitive ion channel family protein [Candidatus Omnitrophica bacterium]|nr:mechanosensitive ion channel family protein [Candidatus Omnitrophota bacterium]